MKKHLLYEAAGMLFALSGAVLLVAVCLLMVHFDAAADRARTPALFFLSLLPVPVLLLLAAWHYNRKAQWLKAEDDENSILPP